MTAPIGHVVKNWLPYSETFIYTLMRFQPAGSGVVFAKTVSNADQFPFSPVLELTPRTAMPRRLVRRAWSSARGFDSTFEHRIFREARRRGCPALHAHHGTSGLLALPTAKRLGLPLVTSFYGRDVGVASYDELFSEGALFTTVGPRMADRLVARGCPRDAVRVLKLGIDLTDFEFRPRPRGRPFVVLQVARLVEKKGVDLSLRAFAAARDRIGPSELWIVGDGPLQPELERLSAELGLGSAVRFLGRRSHAEARDAMLGAQVGIQPSRTASDGDSEGSPTVILEMQATGMPVLATRHADIPAIVPDPDELVAEEDANSLAEALVRFATASDDERADRSRRVRAFVEAHHDAPRIAESLRAIYAEAKTRVAR